MIHISVLLSEILEMLPPSEEGRLLDVTAGGGGHFFEILRAKKQWTGLCWDRDPDAKARIKVAGSDCAERYLFEHRCFGSKPEKELGSFQFILADLGISSFQLDDPARGLSYYSDSPIDFRMNPQEGESFDVWLEKKSEKDLEHYLIIYGEETRAKKFAAALKKIPRSYFSKSSDVANFLMQELHLKKRPGHGHPLAQCFQALRIAVNDELGELESFLTWAPEHLDVGGRLGVITFHSLEDRKVKRGFEKLSKEQFKILTPKALLPTSSEVQQNPRSRSAKLRILERRS